MSFPKYPEYKDSGVEWLGAVPGYWEVLALSRVLAAPITDGPHTTPEFLDDGIPFLSVDGIQDGKLYFEGCRYVSFEDHKEFSKKAAPKYNDLLMGKAASIGKIARVTENIEFSIWSPLALIRVNEEQCNPAFLEFCLKSSELQHQVLLASNSNTQLNIGMKDIPKLRIPLPDTHTQTLIARFLDHETARIDALIEEQQRLIELLKEKRQAVISHAVTKDLDPTVLMKDSGVDWLGEVPAHWAIKRLKQLVIDAAGIQMGPFGGMLVDLDDSDTGFKVYGQENTISGDFSSGNRWIPERRYFALSNYHLKVGDIVLTRKGSLGNCRRISLLPQAGIIDSDTIRVRVQDHMMDPDYLELLLHEAGYISTQLSLVKRGAILSGLNTEIIANLVIVVPPRVEQEELLREIKAASSKFDQGISDCKYAVGLLRERRSALISAAVTGKIDIRGWQSPASGPLTELAVEAM